MNKGEVLIITFKSILFLEEQDVLYEDIVRVNF